MEKYFEDSYIDEQGAEYSADRKVLIQCPQDFEGDFIVPEGVEILAHISGLMPNIKLGRPSALFAFFCCPKLRSVKIPSTVKKIDSWNFSHCPNLEKIEVSPDNPVFDSRSDCHAIIETATNKLIAGGYKSSIPEGVVAIDDFAFWGCVKITDINLPSTLRMVGYRAFFHCDALTELYIPANLTKLESDSFHNCSNLTDIKVDPLNPVYDSRNGCNAIINTERNSLIIGCRKTKIPEGITEIADEAFSCCRELTEITIPESVRHIGDEAFFNCRNLYRVDKMGKFTVGRNAFMNCPLLKDENPSELDRPAFPRFIEEKDRTIDNHRLLSECSSARRWNDVIKEFIKERKIIFSKGENYQSIYTEIKRCFPTIKFGCKTFQNECDFKI